MNRDSKKVRLKKTSFAGTLSFLLFFLVILSLARAAKIDLSSTDEPIDDPELIGPETLCYSIGGESVIGTFYGGGNPLTDTYSWKIFDPEGSEIFSIVSRELDEISYTFSKRGVHTVQLIVSRGVFIYPPLQISVRLQDRPTPTLNSTYTFCEGNPLELEAVDPNSNNFGLFEIIWTNIAGDTISNQNSYTVTESGTYFVELFIPNKNGEPECITSLQTEIQSSTSIQVIASSSILCEDQQILFETSPSFLGDWYLKKSGETNKTFLSTGYTYALTPIILNKEFGSYEIIYEPILEDALNCSIEISSPVSFNPLPEFTFLDPVPSSGCNTPDGGIVIQALTPIDYVYVEDFPIFTPGLLPGDIYTIPNLESGAYNLIAVRGNCDNAFATAVPLESPPLDLQYKIESINGESCTLDGKINGDFTVTFDNGPIDGSFRILGEKGSIVRNGTFTDQTELFIGIPGGNYVFELYNLDSCSLPEKEFIKIPAKEQVNFSIPGDLSICQSYSLIPQSNLDLEFELIHIPTNETEIKEKNEPFEITKGGEYKLIGRIPDQDQFCPVSQTFEITLVDPVEFEVMKIFEDCTGNSTYKAEIYERDSTEVLFTWYNQNDDIVGTGQFLNPTSHGLFKLDVQPANSTSCPIPPLEFIVDEPILSVDVTLEATMLCDFGPEATVNLSTTFPEEVTNIRWRRFSNGEISELPEFDDLWEFSTRDSGTYEASVYSIIPEIQKNCPLGLATIQLNLVPEKVLFNVPSEISVCETFTLIPETNDNLDFFVTTPSGEIIEGESGDSFNLDQEGTYIFLAFDQDSPTPFCPEQKEVTVTLVEPVVFQPKLSEAYCDGSRIYQAELENYSPEDVFFVWRDSNGNIVGEEEFLTLPGPGTYSLEVQPQNSQACPYPPIEFTENPPIFEVEVILDPDPLCPDADSAIITLNTDLDQVTGIEWWFTDLNGNQTQLTNFNDQTEILAIEEGTYEVRAYNFIPCLVGTDQVLILRSQDEVRPIVEESYQICPRYQIGPNIDPGDFASYEWYFDGELVSESPVFKPQQVGEYQLLVYSLEGCVYETSFSTIEECELKVKFPTALMPNDPDKPFLIYTNYLVDELELWIFNQWGELIFHCKNTDLINEESTCVWDGTFNGEKVPNGAYSLRVNYRNIEKNINEEYLGSIMVIE